MTQETLKLSLIERLIKEENEDVLKKLEQLMVKAQLEIHAQESLLAIENNNTQSLDDFHRNNHEWLKKTFTK